LPRRWIFTNSRERYGLTYFCVLWQLFVLLLCILTMQTLFLPICRGRLC